MKKTLLIDTGPLVAFVNQKEQYHHWVIKKLTEMKIKSPILTCEPVITEACFLLRKVYGGEDAIMNLVRSGKIDIAFSLRVEIDDIKELMQKYKSVPMSLADGCLVRMSELYPHTSLLTLDNDFWVYRKNQNQMIDLIIPDDLSISNK